MSDYIQFEGGSFLKSFVASHKSEAAFIETANTKGYAHLFAFTPTGEEDDNRENKLKALYGKVTAKTAAAEPAKETKPEGKKG